MTPTCQICRSCIVPRCSYSRVARLTPGPAYSEKKPAIRSTRSSEREEKYSWVARQHYKAFPYPFRHFCKLCGTGCGMINCPDCNGNGKISTKPGGAGVVFKVGSARCKTCHGIGVIACFECAGYEVHLPPPDGENGPKAAPCEDDHLSIYEWLAQFGS